MPTYKFELMKDEKVIYTCHDLKDMATWVKLFSYVGMIYEYHINEEMKWEYYMQYSTRALFPDDY